MSLKARFNYDTRWRKKQKLTKAKEILRHPPIEVVDVESFPFSSIISNDGITRSSAISVEKYAEDRDIHLAIMASLGETLVDLSDADDDEVRILRFKPETTSFGNRRTETEESLSPSNFPQFDCEICTDTKPASEAYSIRGCSHVYCTQCMASYVGSKVEENMVKIGCPVSGCRGSLEPEDCRPIITAEVFDRWGKALCEAVIMAGERFYCPYKDCSALLIDDGGEVIKEAECPNCRRLFCAQCRVSWHAGIECEEFQKLGKDERDSEDIMLMKLAENKKWRRCPNCRFCVEKSSGCMFLLCRCGNAFCYNCGTLSKDSSHYCHHCKR